MAPSPSANTATPTTTAVDDLALVSAVPARSGQVAVTGLTGTTIDELDGAKYEAEMWCEFDCVAYVFISDNPDEITERIQAARAGEQSWDYVRPLSREELYNLD